MQPTPFRLSQALWTAFRAAKPTHRQSFLQYTRHARRTGIAHRWSSEHVVPSQITSFARCYSDRAHHDDVEKRVKDAKERIDQSLDSRASVAQDAGTSVKPEKEETIVHTLPESSSIVYKKDTPSGVSADPHPSPHERDFNTRHSDTESDGNKYAAWASSQWQNSPLPSQIASLRSRATKRFTSFMDNLQSQIVIAAHHINDLTGYTGIERLKKEIEAQESAVQNARQHVKDSRDQYSQAIAMRSTTQREVNDLLHRKHAWSPTDLERFTHLYRSDHANEQAEQKSHQQLSEAEAQYEESSTRLAKSILARYHEEQIWSDKIRQMSTWGTWGLMGLNVLLFIVFQIAIEPWRRRRLVRGFEEKVQAALDEKERVTDEKLALIQSQRNGDQIVQDAVQQQSEGLVSTAAEHVAELIADAVSGSTESPEQIQESEYPVSQEIEEAAEHITQKELEDEAQIQGEGQVASTLAVAEAIDAAVEASALDKTSPQTTQVASVPTAADNEPGTWQNHLVNTYHQTARTATTTWGSYTVAFAQQFNDKEHIVLSKRELTAKILEGVAAGIAVACGIMFVVARQR